MKTRKNITGLIVIGLLYIMIGCTQIPTTTPTLTPMVSYTATLPISNTLTPTASSTHTPAPTSTNSPVSSAVFPVGPGGVDVIPHQIVRTANDYLYIFTTQQSSDILRVYRTNNAGFPNAASDFAAPIELTEASEPISVDTAYDGRNIIHVLINTQSGAVKDYPFDISSNTFQPAITLASDSGTIMNAGLYIGTSGISSMLDTNGILHFVYWTNKDHILYRTYTYNRYDNSLLPTADFIQLDAAGNANHPVLAISPLDGSITIAWVSQASNPAQILARTCRSNGIWDNIETVSTAPVWTSSDNGLNIDQGPSLIVDASGTRHLTYIEQLDSALGDYGRIHYVTNSGSGWSDQRLNIFSHDPALAINNAGDMYIIGHGHPLNATCKSMNDICVIKKNETWASPVTFASPPSGFSFDSSPSVKWSVVGFNRPDVIEFIFFMTPYTSTTVYYGRLP